MRFPRRLAKCLVAQIDFSVFHVLAVLPHKTHGSVVLLLPKEKTAHSYYGMYIGQKCHWYGTVEQMLDSAVQRNYIGGIQRAVLLLRYRHITKQHQILGG